MQQSLWSQSEEPVLEIDEKISEDVDREHIKNKGSQTFPSLWPPNNMMLTTFAEHKEFKKEHVLWIDY